MDKKKNPVNKNQGPIQQKYKANVSTSRRNPKKKRSKQSTKIRWSPYAKKTHDYEMIINNKKENLRQKNCPLLQID
jgi:hypothetical protein